MKNGIYEVIKELIANYWIEVVAVGSMLGVTIEKTPININPITCIKKIINKSLKNVGEVMNEDLNAKVEVMSEKIELNIEKVEAMEKATDFSNIDIMKRSLVQYHGYLIQNGFLYNEEYNQVRTIKTKYYILIDKYNYLPKDEFPDDDMLDILDYIDGEFKKGNVRFGKPQHQFQHEQEYSVTEFISDEYAERNSDNLENEVKQRIRKK